MHLTYPTKCAYIESKSGRVYAPIPRPSSPPKQTLLCDSIQGVEGTFGRTNQPRVDTLALPRRRILLHIHRRHCSGLFYSAVCARYSGTRVATDYIIHALEAYRRLVDSS